MACADIYVGMAHDVDIYWKICVSTVAAIPIRVYLRME